MHFWDYYLFHEDEFISGMTFLNVFLIGILLAVVKITFFS